MLKQRGYSFWTEDQLEQKIEVRETRPDFYVETPRNGAFLAEVESFEKPGPFRIGAKGGGHVDADRGFKRIRTAVQSAARQLRPYERLGIPMLIVLDNWRMVGIPSNITDLRNALFGTLEFRLPIDLSKGQADTEQAHWHHGGGQFFNEREKLYISAVAWDLPKLRYDDDPMTEERPMYLRMVHNHHARVPFPIENFNNGDDVHYGYVPEGAGLRWVTFLERSSRK